MAELFFRRANDTCDFGCYSERGIIPAELIEQAIEGQMKPKLQSWLVATASPS